MLASMILFTHSFPHTLQVKVLRITMDVSFDPCSDSMLPSERTLFFWRCRGGARILHGRRQQGARVFL